MNMQIEIIKYVQSLSPEAQSDIMAGKWDEVMTDHLYAAVGATSADEMYEARWEVVAALHGYVAAE